MGIEVHQIHNVVRTYQRALQPAAPARPVEPVEPVDQQHDRVSVSAEARERHETESAIPEPVRDNNKRTR